MRDSVEEFDEVEAVADGRLDEDFLDHLIFVKFKHLKAKAKTRLSTSIEKQKYPLLFETALTESYPNKTRCKNSVNSELPSTL